MTNLVTPTPDYLNISNWYELVEGDAIPTAIKRRAAEAK